MFDVKAPISINNYDLVFSFVVSWYSYINFQFSKSYFEIIFSTRLPPFYELHENALNCWYQWFLHKYFINIQCERLWLTALNTWSKYYDKRLGIPVYWTWWYCTPRTASMYSCPLVGQCVKLSSYRTKVQSLSPSSYIDYCSFSSILIPQHICDLQNCSV